MLARPSFVLDDWMWSADGGLWGRWTAVPSIAYITETQTKKKDEFGEERLADECRLQLGILYDGYRPELYWWEVTAVARKVFIAMLAELMEGALQTQCSMLLLLLFVIATVQFRPYASRVLQALEVGSLMVCLLCLWAGGVFSSTLVVLPHMEIWRAGCGAK